MKAANLDGGDEEVNLMKPPPEMTEPPAKAAFAEVRVRKGETVGGSEYGMKE